MVSTNMSETWKEGKGLLVPNRKKKLAKVKLLNA